MNFLVIDGSQDKIKFFSFYNNDFFHKSFTASKDNNDKFSILLFNFLKKNNISLSKLNNIFVNQGPGKFSGIRASISIVKALSFNNKLNLYGFNSEHIKDQNYDKIIDLFNKGLLIKNLIKPRYSS